MGSATVIQEKDHDNVVSYGRNHLGLSCNACRDITACDMTNKKDQHKRITQRPYNIIHVQNHKDNHTKC